MDWLLDIWSKIKESINLLGQSLSNLNTSIDNIQFTDQFIISRILANIHYVVGSPVYIMLVLLLQLGVGFMLWSCIKAIFGIVNQLTPKIKGRFTGGI